MTPRELIAEYKAFLGVYAARISRAQQVKNTFVEMLKPLATDLALAEKAIYDLKTEDLNADSVIVGYKAKIADTLRVVAELESGYGIMGSGEGTRPRKKKPGRLNKLVRLQRKLTKLLEEDPDLAEYLDAVDEEN